jgi:hypothetical protein
MNFVGYTTWDKIDVRGPMTVGELKEHILKEYSVEVSMISVGQFTIFNQYLPNNKHKGRLTQRIEKVYEEIDEKPIPSAKNYLAVVVMGDDKESGIDASMPVLKYYFK